MEKGVLNIWIYILKSLKKILTKTRQRAGTSVKAFLSRVDSKIFFTSWSSWVERGRNVGIKFYIEIYTDKSAEL